MGCRGQVLHSPTCMQLINRGGRGGVFSLRPPARGKSQDGGSGVQPVRQQPTPAPHAILTQAPASTTPTAGGGGGDTRTIHHPRPWGKWVGDTLGSLGISYAAIHAFAAALQGMVAAGAPPPPLACRTSREVCGPLAPSPLLCMQGGGVCVPTSHLGRGDLGEGAHRGFRHPESGTHERPTFLSGGGGRWEGAL